MPYDGKPDEWLLPGGPARKQWDWEAWGIAMVIVMGFIFGLFLVNDVWKEERQRPTYPQGWDLTTLKKR